MPLELLKLMVQPVAIERDGDGKIVGERVGEPVALFTPEQLPEFVAKLREEIEAANDGALSPPDVEAPGAPGNPPPDGQPTLPPSGLIPG